MNIATLTQGPTDGDIFTEIAKALETQGYIILNNALTVESIDSLFIHLKSMNQEKFRRAGIGREQDFHINRFVRTDKISWIKEADNRLHDYLKWIEELRQRLNRQLFLGLFDYECHFAHYPPGAFYKRHYDAFRGQSNRVVTTILYLNPHWSSSDGGELVMYNDDNDTTLETVTPDYGKLVIFLSEMFPHEVLPAKRDRYSLTGWFRINNNLDNIVDPPIRPPL